MSRTQEIYFNWLCGIVGEVRHSRVSSFSQLLRHLHDTEFRYSLSQDGNRASDGIELRDRFWRDTGELTDELEGPCSVLEMMIALSIRCEEYIMVDPEKGDRTSQWFWVMIRSMGLNDMTDARYDDRKVTNALSRLFNRRYAPNGKGGLFTVNHGGVDMRSLQIWDQLLTYLNTIV